MKCFARKMNNFIISYPKQTLLDRTCSLSSCCHADLSSEEEHSKAWLSPEAESFLALQKIILKDMIVIMFVFQRLQKPGLLNL